MKYYISDYGNTRMRNFLVRNGDVKEDSQGIYTLDWRFSTAISKFAIF